ncbi:MAG: hypothetical protein WCG27_13455, partial [Pseudomonadota bacterium]
MDNAIMNVILNYVVKYAGSWLMTTMLLAFFIGVSLRSLIYLTVSCEFKFSREFEKKAKRYLLDSAGGEREHSFHRLVKFLLEKTRYEFFEIKRIYKRRNLDFITSLTDRLFMFEEGAERLSHDTLDQTRYLAKNPGEQPPQLVEVSKSAFDRNHIF